MNSLENSIIFGDFIKQTYQVFQNPLFCAIGFADRSTFENYGSSKSIEFENTFDAMEKILRIQKSTSIYLLASLSYELGEKFEQIESQIPASDFPLYCLYAFKEVSIAGQQEVENSLSNCGIKPPEIDLTELSKFSNFREDSYKNSINKIKTLIEDGEAYQVNLSQKFTLPFNHSPLEYFFTLQKIHPSTYSCYFPVLSKTNNFGTIISHSPELFLEKTGGEITTKPIKGTRRRGLSEAEDSHLMMDLQSSSKDQAELAMIVDIERNDLGKICDIGSVRVTSHANIIQRSNVFHLESKITGKLPNHVDLIEILKAVFPCGSITGAPKIAAQKIISNFENTTRDIYTGSIGVIYPDSNFTLNVAIRSCIVRDKKIKFNSGGGIVHESVPEEEWMETLYKAKGLFEAWYLVNEAG